MKPDRREPRPLASSSLEPSCRSRDDAPPMGASSTVVRGTLAQTGPIAVLHDLEGRRLTGSLRFRDGDLEGSIYLFGGEIAVEQSPRDDGQDPVDLFLALGSGEWSVEAELPPLAVSRGSGSERSGSLAVHVPVDLMSYCEHAGLTGVLELTHEGRRAEAIYDAGELLAIELDGRDATDLHEVFSWEQGRFRIAIDAAAPVRFRASSAAIDPPTEAGWSPAPPNKREDTRQFLRVVEMALSDVIDRSEKARSPTRTSPPMPPPPRRRPRTASIPPAPPRRRRDEPTVQLIYLTGDSVGAAPDDASTRHVHVGTGEVKERVFTEAQPERRASSEGKSMGSKRAKQRKSAGTKAMRGKTVPTAKRERVDAAPKPAADSGSTSTKEEPANPPVSPWKSLLGGTAWALGAVVLGLVILAVLAALPPVE